MIPKAAGETPLARKTFKDYEPGFIHIDIKYLPQMPNETSRRYLFVAIDRATRWVFLHTYANMTERFNGRISELVKQTYFANAAELETTLQHYLKLYNHHISQRAIGSKTPIESLKHWQGLRPELFVKRVYDQAGLDT